MADNALQLQLKWSNLNEVGYTATPSSSTNHLTNTSATVSQSDQHAMCYWAIMQQDVLNFMGAAKNNVLICVTKAGERHDLAKKKKKIMGAE